MGAFEDQMAADTAALFDGEGVEQVIYTARASGVSKEVPAIVERGETLSAGGHRKTDGRIWLPESALAPEILEVRHHDVVTVDATGEQWLINRTVSRDFGIFEAEIEREIKSTFRE